MKTTELCDSLDHFEYKMQGWVATIGGIRRRIVDEWINHTSLKTYGRPPIALSKPLTETQVAEMLSQLASNIQGDLEILKGISSQPLRKEK